VGKDRDWGLGVREEGKNRIQKSGIRRVKIMGNRIS